MMFNRVVIKASISTRLENDLRELAKLYPIIPTTKSDRSWWKKMARTFTEEKHLTPEKSVIKEFNTFKFCVGMYDFTNCGYIVQWIHDVEFYINKTGDVSWELPPMIPNDWFHEHGKEQTDTCPVQHGDGGKCIIKVDTPFLIETPKNWSLLFCKPFYSYTNDFDICWGILDSDQKEHSCHAVSIFFRFNVRDKIIKFKAGDPMVQLVPIHRIPTRLEFTEDPSKELQEQQLNRFVSVHSKFDDNPDINGRTLEKYTDRSFWKDAYK